MWQPTGALPQSITLDLGQVQPDVGWLGYVPRYSPRGSSKDGNVTHYRILTSTDGTTFTMATTGTWPADGKMKSATFGPVAARYVRLEARPPTAATARSPPRSRSARAGRAGSRSEDGDEDEDEDEDGI